MTDQAPRPQFYSSVTIDPIVPMASKETHEAASTNNTPSVVTSQEDRTSASPNDASLDPATTSNDANFFWLSAYKPSELVGSFLKPVSAKSSTSSFFQTERPLSAKPSNSSLRRNDEADSRVRSPSSPPISPTVAHTDSSTAPNTSRDSKTEPAEEKAGIFNTTNPFQRSSGLSESQQPTPHYPSGTTASTLDIEKTPMPEPIVWKPGRSEWLCMVTMAISCLTVALDATILVPVLPTLALDLNGTAAEAFWTGTSYLLASAVVQPFIAALSDIFGRREATLASLVLFAVASIICAVAHNFTTLLTGRVFQGIGGGGIITLTQLIFADIVPLRKRPQFFSLVLGSWAVGTLLGPLTGGIFVQDVRNWRWCFYINLPICGVAIPMAFFFLKFSTVHRTLVEKLRLVDWTGGCLFVSSMTSFLIAVSWGGVTYPWSSWRTLVPLILGAAGVSATIFYESRFASNPFLNRNLFQSPSSVIAYLLALFQGLLLFMTLYYASFYFSAAKLYRPVHAGVNLFPATVLLLPGSIICSQLITRYGVYRPFIWIGWSVTAVGTGMMIPWSDRTSTPYWAATTCIVGLGLGIMLSCINFAVQASTEPVHSGAAAAMYAFMRSLGMSLGVAIGGTIFQNLMRSSLRSDGLDEAIATNAEAWVETTLRNLPNTPDDVLRTSALQAYTHGFRGIWIVMTSISVFALVLSFFIRHFSMDKILDSKFVVEKSNKEQEASNPVLRKLSTITGIPFDQGGGGTALRKVSTLTGIPFDEEERGAALRKLSTITGIPFHQEGSPHSPLRKFSTTTGFPF